MLLSEAIQAFITYKVNRYGSTRTTEVTYKSNLNDFCKFAINIPVAQLTLELIDEYIECLANRDYKPKTYKNKIVIVRSLIKYLYSKSLTDIRPQSIVLPKIVPTEANFLSPEEQQNLVDGITHVRDRAIILTMLQSGLRVSEVSELRTDDLYNRSIVVRCGKGKKPRVTFISMEAEQAINTYLKTKAYTEYLFTNHHSKRLSRQSITKMVSYYGSLAKTHKHITAHTLRHTFATNLLQMGARIEDVQPMMGHSNIQTTRMYMHFTNDYLHKRYDEVMQKNA